ncbi:RNA-directed DNA polymerase from mobile element jockey-like protein [Elysia marginata]|uniref:RNA-directed DNA polymerase from mobile element jockey-like protein n=1 Tax=Elysia marginata TaxID=1093978 RepID=A0AAV4JGL2_9GAST|nr:RNA-directed DNA polymerase from mobile element jockey-like protein [Elysia marginata]
MLDKTSSDRPERRSALVAHELLRLNIDIASLSEVRFPDKGSLNEHGAGYTLYWSGRQPEQRRISGVGIMIKDSLSSKLETLPTGYSDRIMSMRLALDKNQHLTLFSVYAPTLQAEPVEKDNFYSELGRLLTNTHAGDKVLILGDFNARLGGDSDAWDGILGRHGVGNCNDNGRLLLGFCTEHQLTVTNTVFQQKDRLKTTWMHPRSKHWHLLDYILVRKQDLRDVLHTREQGNLPQDLRDAIVITLYKNKGGKSECSNYRGITLLSIAGKVLARILLNRLVSTIAEENLPESQCGFRSNRGTTDMVFVLRQLQEKCREQNKGLYITFVDLTKAFDTVSRTGLWRILERLGCPPKFLQMVIQLHQNQQGHVRLNGDVSEFFPISNCVKQGCVLAPTLFSIFFSKMIEQATEDLAPEDGVYVRYLLDGSLFNLRRFQAHTKTQERLIRDLLFADDAALVAHTEKALQRITSCFAETSSLFGLEVSLKKTEVLHQPAPHDMYIQPRISINNTGLKATSNSLTWDPSFHMMRKLTKK